MVEQTALRLPYSMVRERQRFIRWFRHFPVRVRASCAGPGGAALLGLGGLALSDTPLLAPLTRACGHHITAQGLLGP